MSRQNNYHNQDVILRIFDTKGVDKNFVYSLKPSKIVERQCVVLNSAWHPIGIINLQRALTMLFSATGGMPKAKIVDENTYQVYSWKEWSELDSSPDSGDILKSASGFYRIPKIIILTNYSSVPERRMSFSRRAIYKRDNFTCQYCGKRVKNSGDITIDHVVPKSRGGKTCWENCVVACFTCNSKKGNKMLKEAGMRLLRKPKRPEEENMLARRMLEVLSTQQEKST